MKTELLLVVNYLSILVINIIETQFSLQTFKIILVKFLSISKIQLNSDSLKKNKGIYTYILKESLLRSTVSFGKILTVTYILSCIYFSNSYKQNSVCKKGGILVIFKPKIFTDKKHFGNFHL